MSYFPQLWVQNFHRTFAPDVYSDCLEDQIERRACLIEEEHEEVQEALELLDRTDLGLTSCTVEEALEQVAKELADLVYVAYGTADELGIPLQEVIWEVHKSNMSKAEPDGTVNRNEFGKVLKPSTYTPPDLSFIHEYQFLSKSS